jgi:BirA family biotin operon repressor/biotin-[acetyl-CoA-carboxylase] ligase
MSNKRIPDILTDLSHVGTAGLLLGESPTILQELEICRRWGFLVEQEGDRVFLRFDDEQIVPYWIQRETPDLAWDGLRVNGFLRIDSTNKQALLQARMGAPSGTLICAEEQTMGRGRGDRVWHSPAKTGLYFSLIVRPRQESRFWPLLTHVASIALVRTLQDLIDIKVIKYPLDVDIKWPNDVLISGKKCAGILLETLTEEGNPAVVVGVGINVHRGSVPAELSVDAVCIDEPAQTVVPRRKVLVGFLRNFQIVYVTFESGKHGEILENWKRHSTMWENAHIWIEEGERRRSAVTCGLNEIGALMVDNEDGSRETVVAGDVRIRRSPV